jgi:hypothetical protein
MSAEVEEKKCILEKAMDEKAAPIWDCLDDLMKEIRSWSKYMTLTPNAQRSRAGDPPVPLPGPEPRPEPYPFPLDPQPDDDDGKVGR